MISRRAFARSMMATTAAATAGQAMRGWGQGSPAWRPRPAAGAAMALAANFTGLGYEMLSVARPGLLSAANRRYVTLTRGLGRAGVARVGGIVANYTRFDRDGRPAFAPKDTVITEAALKQFAGFLRAVDWSAIWSVNFAQGSIDQAVVEARAVAEALGPRLLALEIGNEVESYGRGQPFRADPYTYEQYRKEFAAWRAAIAEAVPGVGYAAPDTARNVEWVERMAQDARGQVQLLSTHYYRNGQRQGSADQLLRPDPRLAEVIARLRAASQQSGIPWRICEINSFSGGGLPGVSNTMVGALWTLNTMLLLAQNGSAGVNMETGVNQLGFVSSYSPIQDDGRGVNTAGVPYYGMLAFAAATAGCDQMLALEDGDAPDGIFAYAPGSAGRARGLTVVNLSQAEAQVSLSGLGVEDAAVLRMEAPSPESTTGVTFAGAEVDSDGHWKARRTERLRRSALTVPAMSAAVVCARAF